MQAPHLAAWLAGESPGAIVPTTLRFELQSALSQLVVEERGQFADRAQIAVVAIDNRSGAVVAWLGGSDFFGRAGQVDLVRSRRSPGSALKPLIYAMAFDDRVLHPEWLIEDVPVRFRDWLPRNHHDHVGAGTVRRALQQSERAGRAGAREGRATALHLDPGNAAVVPGLPPGGPATRWRALGSATVSPLKWPGFMPGWPMAASLPRPPCAAIGRSRSRAADRPDGHLVCRRRAGRGAAADGFASLPVALRDRRIAFKTGTSAGFRDAWAAGDSANWTVVVWVGHADGTPRPGQLGRVSAAGLLRVSAACPPRTTAPSRRPPTCCASLRITSCRCACAPWGRAPKARARRA